MPRCRPRHPRAEYAIEAVFRRSPDLRTSRRRAATAAAGFGAAALQRPRPRVISRSSHGRAGRRLWFPSGTARSAPVPAPATLPTAIARCCSRRRRWPAIDALCSQPCFGIPMPGLRSSAPAAYPGPPGRSPCLSERRRWHGSSSPRYLGAPVPREILPSLSARSPRAEHHRADSIG